jgi:small-conductance mechanosensitive channel
LKGDAALLRASRVAEITRGLTWMTALGLGSLVVYAWLTFSLRQFPFTRPWGETLRTFLFTELGALAWGALQALPSLFIVAVIFFVTRFISRLTSVFFETVERGRFEIGTLDRSTAVPTRRLARTLLWLFALVVAYPYLPGSHTEAFKGVSVLVGLMVSLGSTGVVNQVMSGYMVTYSGALRPGDDVRIGDVEGPVLRVGVLATFVRTVRGEDVSIPNGVVIAGTAVNYSRNAGDAVFGTVAITIGYDTAWRQVKALLLEAAARTSGLRRQPAPRVLPTNLLDHAVEYTLAVPLERPSEMVATLAELRSHVLDTFNEYGVQIMSPHYEDDPAAPKVVPKAEWFAAPAVPPGGASKVTMHTTASS